MKVSIVTTSFPRWQGDHMAPFIFEGARALHDRGLKVQVIASHCPGARTKEDWDGLEVLRPRYMWPESLEVLQSEPGGLPLAWKRRPYARIEFLPLVLSQALATIRHSRRCDLIHANWTLSAVATWLGRPMHRRRYVVTVHGSDIYQAARLPLARSLTFTALRGARRIFAPSKSLRDATVKLGIPPEQLEVVPDGVDVTRFRPSSGDRWPVILFVGWLIARKGVRYLIESMAELARRDADHRLVIIGEGPLREELSNLAADLGIEARVDFAGPRTPEEVAHWMSRAKLLVLPSLEEGLGVVLLEALASGTPCVASRVGGIQDVISDEVGILAEPGDSASLTQSIDLLLGDRARWNRLSRSARRVAEERYSWEVVATRLRDAYECVLAS